MSELIPTPPEKQTSIESWTPLEAGLSIPINGVHLGRIEQPEGGATYKDEAHTLVDEAGFIFTVTQSSAGFTGIYVNPTEGHAVSTLAVDPETKVPQWAEPSISDPQILVSGDWGQLVNNPDILDAKWDDDTKFGEAGVHAGIIKVTSADGQTRYFGLAADFAGQEDNWDVTGKIVELAPKSELDAPAPKPLEA
ncbi:MAG: hypothetical protein JWO99_27 [Candidatus Saccharibacteria bacterium]|nr:hypothetical protein [Candidatus Saccharibacteria bacterium]